jgi:threonine/homoserine/homoserine lactone efflux protein
MIFKGFKFGMLLQIAVGPVCLFILQTSISLGFLSAMTGVVSVTLIDSLFILSAILGIGALIDKYRNVKKAIQYFGAAVLIAFGLSNILGVLGISIFPSINFLTKQTTDSVFIKMVLLTLSNPLTILFWAGVFSSKIAYDNMNKPDMYRFGTGAVLSTIVFLTFVSALGHFINVFVSLTVLNLLNVLVGLVLIIFGIKTSKKEL